MDFSTDLADQLSEVILKSLEPLHKLVLELLAEKRKPFISLDEASRYLEISKATLYSYVSKNLLPGYKLNNRKIYLKIEDLDNFVLGQENRISTKNSEKK